MTITHSFALLKRDCKCYECEKELARMDRIPVVEHMSSGKRLAGYPFCSRKCRAVYLDWWENYMVNHSPLKGM